MSQAHLVINHIVKRNHSLRYRSITFNYVGVYSSLRFINVIENDAMF